MRRNAQKKLKRKIAREKARSNPLWGGKKKESWERRGGKGQETSKTSD